MKEVENGVEVSADIKKKTPKPESIKRNERRAKQSPSHVKSIIEPTDDEAKELLTARNIRHPRVLEVLGRLAKTAARENKIPVNAHLVTHGLQNTLAAREGKEMM